MGDITERLRDFGGPSAWAGRAERENACEGCCGPYGDAKPEAYKDDLDFLAMREAADEIERLRKERDGERKRYADLADGFWRIVDSAQIKGGLPSCELNALSRIVDRLAKAERERDKARAALAPLLSAAQGLRNGTDWNKGTFAITHGYRQALLDAIPAAERAALPTPEAT